MTAQEQVDYPLPVIHMNGTGAEGLMAGYENVYDCLDKLQEAMEKCIVHGRDYYPLDEDQEEESFRAAWNERHKHNKAINDFKDYIFEHMVHINDQSK
tara:strand:+ start:434 stop:727 length:294 start_codon:yes stop_codon:yes gene_type:complete